MAAGKTDNDSMKMMWRSNIFSERKASCFERLLSRPDDLAAKVAYRKTCRKAQRKHRESTVVEPT